MLNRFLKLPAPALLLAFATSACGVFGADPVEVRVTNDSAVPFDQVSLFTADGIEEYSDLAAGASTPFITVSLAYRSATTQVVVGTDTARLQVIDFVGETPLDGARYSYALDVIGGPGDLQLTQTLRREGR